MQEIIDLQKKLLEMAGDLDSFCKQNGIEYYLAYGSALGAVRHKGFIPWDDDFDVMMTYQNYFKFIDAFKNNDKYYLQRETIDYPLQFSKLRCNNTAFIEKIQYRKKYRNMHQGIYIDIYCLDTVSPNRLTAFKQVFFSNIIISQSLFLRGYQTKNILKNISILLSVFFMPFRMSMIAYVRKANGVSDFDRYTSYFDIPRKVYIKKEVLGTPVYSQFEDIFLPLPTDAEAYLKNAYGNYMQLPPEKDREKKVHASFFSTTESYLEYIL